MKPEKLTYYIDMKKLKVLLLTFQLFVGSALFAAAPDEGMWLPMLLKDYNYDEMERLGCKLTAEQIYAVNTSSIKDAVVRLGGFCTAEVISDQGLTRSERLFFCAASKKS